MFNTNFSNIYPVVNRTATRLADNTDFDGVLQEGWYDIYDSEDIAITHAPASGLGRVLLRVDTVNIGGIWIKVQTVREWYSTISISAKTWVRWTYSLNGALTWTRWTNNIDSKIGSGIQKLEYRWDNQNPKLIVTDPNGYSAYVSLTKYQE